MSDLAKFIRRRIDEDEAVARAADVKQGDPEWWVSPVASMPGSFTVRSRRDNRPIARIQTLDGDEGETAAILDGSSVADHVARYDPKRALDEAATKRRLLGLAMCLTDSMANDPAANLMMAQMGEGIYKALIRPYVDHPDCRPEWRP